MRLRTRRRYYFMYESEKGRGFFFGVFWKCRTVQAYGENGERLNIRGYFYYVLSDGSLYYEVHHRTKRVSYKNYFVTCSRAIKKHKILKYKEYEKLLILFGPENKKMAPNAGEENPTPEANNPAIP